MPEQNIDSIFNVLSEDLEQDGKLLRIYAERIFRIFELACFSPDDWTKDVVLFAYELLRKIEEDRHNHKIPIPRSQRVCR